MTNLRFALVADDKSHREDFTCSFKEDEWNLVNSFFHNAEQLRSTRFVQNERGGSIAINWKAGRGIESKAKPVDLDEAWSMMLKLRPFVLKKEDCYFHKYKNLLKRRLDHIVFRQHINELVELFNLKDISDIINIRGPGRSPISIDVVMDWLNSYEYHKDSTKRHRVDSDLGIFGKDQNGMPIILFAIVEMIRAVLCLGDLSETLVKMHAGELTEILCFSGYFATE